MNKISRRDFLKVAGVSAAALGLAACGEDKGTAASVASSASTAASSVAVKDVALKVWGPQEDQADDASWLPTTCKQFQTEHPEWNITFTYEVCPEGDAAKNVAPDPTAAGDVYFFANDQIGTLVDANAISELGRDALTQIQNDNSETMVKSVTGADGGVYGVPFTGNTWFMYYDKSAFTADEIKSLDAMLAKGKVAFPLTNSWYIASFFVANGCTLFGADGNDAAAGIDFGGDKGAAVTKYLVNMVANANFVNDADGAGIAGLRDGSIKAIFSGTWDAASVKEALGDNYAAAQLPTITIDGAEKQLRSFSGSKAIAVNPNCANPEVAVALAAYLGSADAQKSHYEMRNIIPCVNSLLTDATISADPAAVAQNNTIANTSILQPTISEMGNYWTPAENFGKSIYNKEVTEANAAEKTEAFNASFKATL